MNAQLRVKFDQLLDSMRMALAENNVSLLVQDQRGITHLLYDGSDRDFGTCDIALYAITDPANFMIRLAVKLDVINPTEVDVDVGETHEAVWELLDQYLVVHFDEF